MNTRENPGARWIAHAHPVPEQVWAEWDTSHRLALIPTGRLWDVIVLPHTQLQSLAMDMAPKEWARVPLLVEAATRPRAYVFVPLGTAEHWDEPGTHALGDGAWIVAPNPEETHPTATVWVEAPGPFAPLMNPNALREALHRIAGRVGDLDEDEGPAS